MALTRKSLKAMGLTDEQVDSVIEMHTETVDALKAQITEQKEAVSKLEEITEERDALKEAAAKSGDADERYNALNGGNCPLAGMEINPPENSQITYII